MCTSPNVERRRQALARVLILVDDKLARLDPEIVKLGFANELRQDRATLAAMKAELGPAIQDRPPGPLNRRPGQRGPKLPGE